MMKYRLVKTYPGSPELSTEVEKDSLSKSYFYRDGDKRWCVLNDHVENNPEYWEEVYESPLSYMVVTEGGIHDFKVIMTPAYLHEGINDYTKHIFKTKEEAEEFILHNKPCLSYNNIAGYLSSSQRDVILNLIKKL
jgi:hypothetical protein